MDMIRGVIARFPLVVLFAYIGTGFAVHAVDGTAPDWMEKLIIVFLVSFFVGLAGYIFAERFGRDKMAVSVLMVIFAEGYFWFLPEGFEMMRSIDVAQIFLLLTVSVIAVFSVPYLLHQQVNGFWQYNRQLMRRFLFTAISTGTLFVGIVISLASMQFLFDWQIQSEWYFRIWILIVGLVSTVVFLAGIPKQFDHLEVMGEYPYVFEVFSKYILVPLLMLYGSILYVYGGKILLVGEWPKGTVSVLVSWYALLGIATCFLLFPRRDQSMWVRPMAKIFYATLIPLALLLLGAVIVRAVEYGWTANRGGMTMFGVWLIGVSLFNLTKKRDDIRLLFFVTAISIFVFSFGPLSVFSAAERSQSSRLEEMLTKNSILVDGRLNRGEKPLISKKDTQEIRSTVEYLWDIRGLDIVSGWSEVVSEDPDLGQVFAMLGLVEGMEQEQMIFESPDTRYAFRADRSGVVDISGFSRLYQFTCNPTCALSEGAEEMAFENGVLQVKEKTGKSLVTVDLAEKSQRLLNEYVPEKEKTESYVDQSLDQNREKKVPVQEMVFEKVQGKLKIRLIFEEMIVKQTDDKNTVESFSGMLFITRP